MGAIILTSCGFINDLVKNTFLQKLPSNFIHMNVGIITTASEKKEKNLFAIKAYNDFLQMGFTNVEFLDIEKEQVNLEKFSIIYINGGNPFRLLHFFKINNLDRQLIRFCQRNTFLIGVSAGAIILGPTLELVQHFTPQLNEYSNDELTGLNITTSCIFPHYDRSDLFGTSPTMEERIQAFERETNLPVIRLKDDEFLIKQIKKA